MSGKVDKHGLTLYHIGVAAFLWYAVTGAEFALTVFVVCALWTLIKKI